MNLVSNVTGWEHGSLYVTGHGSTPRLSIEDTIVRTGAHSLKIAHAGTQDYWASGGAIVTDKSARVYHYLDSIPSVDVFVAHFGQTAGFDRRGGIGIRGSTGCYAAFVRAPNGLFWGADGPAATTGEWRKLEWDCTKVGGSGELQTVTGTVDDVALDPAAHETGTTTSSLESTLLGNSDSGNTDTYDEYFDDLIVYDGLVLPIGAGGSELLLPDGEGTHSSASKFTDSNANMPPTNPHLLVDDDPQSTSSTDYFYQSTADDTAYIELTMGDLVNPGQPNGIAVGVSAQMLDGPDFVDINQFWLKVIDAGYSDVSLFVQLAAIGPVARAWSVATFRNRTGGGDPVWTNAEVNAIKARVGYMGGIVPLIYVHSVFMEVDVADTAIGQGYWGVLIRPSSHTGTGNTYPYRSHRAYADHKVYTPH